MSKSWDKYSDDEIVEAIGKAENSEKFPYGVKSIDTHGDKERARKICLNSVRNGRSRWIAAGKPDDLIVFIGRRYSPPDVNPNWVRLVKYFLQKDGVSDLYKALLICRVALKTHPEGSNLSEADAIFVDQVIARVREENHDKT